MTNTYQITFKTGWFSKIVLVVKAENEKTAIEEAKAVVYWCRPTGIPKLKSVKMVSQ